MYNVILANAGIHLRDYHWIPAYAGMTTKAANCQLLFTIFERSRNAQKKSINQGDPFLYDMDRAKGVIGEQIRKIKKNPLASREQEDWSTMEVRYKKSLALHLRCEPKSEYSLHSLRPFPVAINSGV